ncbi:MAG TPA: YbhB/YbcL family Raf kinase inhibitor-like protein [Sphingomicrobium sp.]|nr:YbhB/YbcL family Raf kinase inhibitor-like protein [Sphingomicrobium sp.]
MAESGMRRGVKTAALLAFLAGCGAESEAEMTGFLLKSSAFADGSALPTEFTCDGADQSPPLEWSEPPRGTKSFALIVDDPDAPSGTFSHWAAFNIPGTARDLAPGAGNQSEGMMIQAKNDFGKPGYGGACPPNGHGPHRYRFKLLALDVDRLDIPSDAKVKDVEAQAEAHLVARAELTGTYERK